MYYYDSLRFVTTHVIQACLDYKTSVNIPYTSSTLCLKRKHLPACDYSEIDSVNIQCL